MSVMRFALGEVKKRVTRHNGDVWVAPYLLAPRERTRDLEALIQLFEAYVGQARGMFPEERPAELIGDYRLARCLMTCLLEWYDWLPPEWPGPVVESESNALAAAGISSASELRLSLYDYVNQRWNGYLASAERDKALDSLAAAIGISRAALNRLLRLDYENEARLIRTASARPTAAQLALRYNQRAVETLLSHASHIEWVLPATMTDGAGGGLGTVVKRVCFLARKMGVRYDVAFTGPHLAIVDPPLSASRPPANSQEVKRRSLDTADNAPAPLENFGQAVSIILYGPTEVMGAPAQYGERLARLARALLGYRRSEGGGRAALAQTGLSGRARMYLYGRPAWFRLDSRLIRLLGVLDRDPEDAVADVVFDSSLEHDLYSDFASLSTGGEARGWELEREPEPILVADTILVPDFALTRGRRRVYLEIAGYWRPGYRERKARKLALLRRRVDLIIAAPESARAEFADVADDFPFLWYSNHPRAQAVLDLLERDFNDRDERLGAVDIRSLCREVVRRGRVSVRESMALLHVYSRSEVTLAVSRIGQDQSVLWLEGIGLCSTSWLQTLEGKISTWVGEASEQRLPLSVLHQLISTEETELGELGGSAVELLAQRSGCSVSRSSIFDIEVLAPGAVPAAPETPVESPARMLRPQPRTAIRRKQSRAQYETPLIFGVEPPDDNR
jgi:predicted nuclease of restriction endonuclease-like RecB superfamily